MGMGKGARRIRMEVEEKQTSTLLPWCHLGTGSMERQTSSRMGREEEDKRGQQSMEVSKMPAERGWLRCRFMTGSVEGCWREKSMIPWNCEWVRDDHWSYEEKCQREILYSVHFSTFLSLYASHCVPANGHRASLQSWHNRSDQSGQGRAVLVKDKKTHLWGFAANHHLFAWTKPKRGAQATVASDSVMASFQWRRGHREEDGTLPSQHNTHICKHRPPYSEQNISDALSILAMASPQGRDQKQRWMAPCQTQTGRHSWVPPEAVQMRSTCKHKIVAEGWNQSHKCNFGGTMEQKQFFSLPTQPSGNCYTVRKLLLPLWRTKKKGSYHSVMVKKRIGITSKMNKAYRRGKEEGILC